MIFCKDCKKRATRKSHRDRGRIVDYEFSCECKTGWGDGRNGKKEAFDDWSKQANYYRAKNKHEEMILKVLFKMKAL